MAISATRKPQSATASNEDYPLPKSSDDWKLALERIKILYLRRQYKQCATCANELLEKSRGIIHSVYKTYIHFYIAICYEELGRAAHNYSRNKLQYLHMALDSLTACSLSLPAIITVSTMEEPNPAILEYTPSSPSDISIVESIWSSVQCGREETPVESPIPSDDDPFISPDSNLMNGIRPLKFKLSPEDMEKSDLMPAPLRIRKRPPKSKPGANVMNDTEPPNVLSLPSTPPKGRPLPPLPLKVKSNRRVFAVSLKECPDLLLEQKQSSPITPPYGEAIIRYNNHIRSFSSQLNATIADVSSLIASVTELQQLHRASKIKRSASFWSFTPAGSPSVSPARPRVSEETKYQRITRLRADGWSTIGLKSEQRGWKGRDYYRNLCSEVLDELYELKEQ